MFDLGPGTSMCCRYGQEKKKSRYPDKDGEDAAETRVCEGPVVGSGKGTGEDHWKSSTESKVESGLR